MEISQFKGYTYKYVINSDVNVVKILLHFDINM